MHLLETAILKMIYLKTYRIKDAKCKTAEILRSQDRFQIKRSNPLNSGTNPEQAHFENGTNLEYRVNVSNIAARVFKEVWYCVHNEELFRLTPNFTFKIKLFRSVGRKVIFYFVQHFKHVHTTTRKNIFGKDSQIAVWYGKDINMVLCRRRNETKFRVAMTGLFHHCSFPTL